MIGILPLENRIQEYAWGSHTAIPRLLGRAPSGRPQAELWMGAHPVAPSLALVNGSRVPLPELIAAHPQEILGAQPAARFQGRFPFLLKVLAAAEPLSIQAHPDLEQARQGYRRENEEGIPLAAPQRNYRDDNHKPELLAALTPFWGMSGFRRLARMRELLGEIDSASLRRLLPGLQEGAGLRVFFAALMSLEEGERLAVADAAAAAGQRLAGRLPPGLREEDPPALPPGLAPWWWVRELGRRYPGDVGVLSPLLLNLTRLEPGQALFLPAGVLHAYLAGTGIEVMASSDNVIRGGLTGKHVDVPELLRILRFRGVPPALVEPRSLAGGEEVYPAPAAEFRLSRVRPDPGYRSPADRGVDILICVEGQASLRWEGGTGELGRGRSLLAPAGAGAYELTGKATIFRATVPPPP